MILANSYATIAPTLVSSSYRRPARDAAAICHRAVYMRLSPRCPRRVVLPAHCVLLSSRAPCSPLFSQIVAPRRLAYRLAYTSHTARGPRSWSYPRVLHASPLFADSRPSPPRVHVRPRIHLAYSEGTTHLELVSPHVHFMHPFDVPPRVRFLNAYTLPLVVCAHFFLVCVHAPRTRTHAHALVACICTNSPCSVLACTYARSACQRCDRSLHVHACMCMCSMCMHVYVCMHVRLRL